jgi:hypothetical protein
VRESQECSTTVRYVTAVKVRTVAVQYGAVLNEVRSIYRAVRQW